MSHNFAKVAPLLVQINHVIKSFDNAGNSHSTRTMKNHSPIQVSGVINLKYWQLMHVSELQSIDEAVNAMDDFE